MIVLAAPFLVVCLNVLVAPFLVVCLNVLVAPFLVVYLNVLVAPFLVVCLNVLVAPFLVVCLNVLVAPFSAVCVCLSSTVFSCLFDCLSSIPSRHAESDPEAFWIRPVMAITASVQPESGRIVYAGSDFPHPSHFRFLFPKKAWTILCKTDPDPIWMAWSGFGQTHLV